MLGHKAVSSAAALKKEVEAHAETRQYLKDAAKAGDSKSSTADKAKIQNQQTEIRKLNQKGMLVILESRKVPIYRVHTMVW